MFRTPSWILEVGRGWSWSSCSLAKLSLNHRQLPSLRPYSKGFKLSFLRRAASESLHFLPLVQTFEVLGDFDLTFVDLGGDVKGVEEVNLGGVETSGSGRDGEVDGSDSAYSGFSGDLVGFELGLELVDWSVGEDEGNLVLQVNGVRALSWGRVLRSSARGAWTRLPRCPRFSSWWSSWWGCSSMTKWAP